MKITDWPAVVIAAVVGLATGLLVGTMFGEHRGSILQSRQDIRDCHKSGQYQFEDGEYVSLVLCAGPFIAPAPDPEPPVSK